MSSLRKIIASRANGARSRGPVTPQGIERSAQNARRHGLLAKCVVLDNESKETFEELLADHIARFQPADGIEFGMIEEMASAYWRMRRAWAVETRTINKAIAAQTEGDAVERIASAFSDPAGSLALTLLHRYETRLHTMHQRALYNLLLLRTPGVRNEPNPISEHSEAPLALAPPDPE